MSRYQPMQPKLVVTSQSHAWGGLVQQSSNGHRWPIPVVWDPYSWYRSERTTR